MYHTLPVALRADPSCPIAAACQRRLSAAGVAVRRYVDGRTLEADIQAGRVASVIEMELIDVASDPERLTAAA